MELCDKAHPQNGLTCIRPASHPEKYHRAEREKPSQNYKAMDVYIWADDSNWGYRSVTNPDYKALIIPT